MLTFLKTLFQKKTAAVVASPSVSAAQPRVASPARTAEHGTPVPQVAVARLSLLPILQKLPADLQANILKFPDATPTIALPLATIQKQLAAGSVKMSLASLYRQAPAGTFTSAKVEDKRMIEVPLSEVLRHVQPMDFKRRADQRRVELPSSAPQLFSDRANPYSLAPSEGEEPEPEPAAKSVNGTNGHTIRFEEEPPAGETAPPYTLPLRMKAEPVEEEDDEPAAPARPIITAAPAAPPVQGEVSIPLALLMGSWPEPARSEAAALAEAVLEIPAAQLASMLVRGKVAFSWGQVRGWIKPAPAGPTEAREGTEIVLPLKVVAPAFLAHSRPNTARKEVDLDETIPALFDGGEAARPVTPAPEPPPVELVAHLEVPLPASPALRMEMPPVVEEESAPVSLPFRLAAEPPVEAEAPAPVAEPAAPKAARSPQEVIEQTAKLPGVAGAIVALREGLPVAAKLPANMKADTVAAFLPQIFARLNNYTQEMQLGEVDDLLLTVNGAHFQGYHMGEIYFAVLGQVGQALPWHEIREVVQELQTQAPA